MSFNSVFHAEPTLTAQASPSLAPALGVDTSTGNLKVNLGSGSSSGWVPANIAVANIALLAQTANVANVLTYAVPANSGGQWLVTLYETASNTPTGATLPAVTVTYTDRDTSASITQTVASVGSVSANTTVSQATLVINPAVSTNIVIATTSYAAGSGTALAYNIKARIVPLGF